MNFETFSIQWLCIAIVPFVFPLFFINRIAVLVSIARIGTVALYCYMIFIIYIFVDNLASGNVGKYWERDMHLFSPNLIEIIGNFALGFMI
jgi:sodium-coupled neutral amino acid transporter 9